MPDIHLSGPAPMSQKTTKIDCQLLKIAPAILDGKQKPIQWMNSINFLSTTCPGPDRRPSVLPTPCALLPPQWSFTNCSKLGKMTLNIVKNMQNPATDYKLIRYWLWLVQFAEEILPNKENRRCPVDEIKTWTPSTDPSAVNLIKTICKMLNITPHIVDDTTNWF